MCGTLLVIIHLYEVTGWLSATLQDDGQAVWFTCHYYNPVTWALLWRGSINVLIVDSTCHYYNPVTWALLWRGSPVTITIQLPGHCCGVETSCVVHLSLLQSSYLGTAVAWFTCHYYNPVTWAAVAWVH